MGKLVRIAPAVPAAAAAKGWDRHSAPPLSPFGLWPDPPALL